MNEEREPCPVTTLPCNCEIMCSFHAQSMMIAADPFMRINDFFEAMMAPPRSTFDD